MKNITLCADDYGQNEPVSTGILQLIELGRLSAVSCMTGYAHWPTYAAQLAALKDTPNIKNQLDVGLHFDLTEFIAQQGWSFNQFIIQCCLGKVDLHKVEVELNRQLDAFEAQLNMAPEFVDGHQHIHVFPGIRRVFVRTLTQRYPKKLPYIRLSRPVVFGHDSTIKALILRSLAIGFARLAQQHKLHFPSQFLGMYSLRPGNYAQHFSHWLQQAKPNSLFMCHPGLPSSDSSDPIKKARFVEFTYFSGEQFLTDLNAQQVTLNKWTPSA